MRHARGRRRNITGCQLLARHVPHDLASAHLAIGGFLAAFETVAVADRDFAVEDEIQVGPVVMKLRARGALRAMADVLELMISAVH